MRRWGIHHHRWWMLQWSFDGTFSLGLHLDPKRRLADDGYYGPYLDLHLGPFALSVGNHPARAWNYSLMRPLWGPK